jgi:hypothetical protein
MDDNLDADGAAPEIAQDHDLGTTARQAPPPQARADADRDPAPPARAWAWARPGAVSGPPGRHLARPGRARVAPGTVWDEAWPPGGLPGPPLGQAPIPRGGLPQGVNQPEIGHGLDAPFSARARERARMDASLPWGPPRSATRRPGPGRAPGGPGLAAEPRRPRPARGTARPVASVAGAARPPEGLPAVQAGRFPVPPDRQAKVPGHMGPILGPFPRMVPTGRGAKGGAPVGRHPPSPAA